MARGYDLTNSSLHSEAFGRRSLRKECHLVFTMCDKIAIDNMHGLNQHPEEQVTVLNSTILMGRSILWISEICAMRGFLSFWFLLSLDFL